MPSIRTTFKIFIGLQLFVLAIITPIAILNII